MRLGSLAYYPAAAYAASGGKGLSGWGLRLQGVGALSIIEIYIKPLKRIVIIFNSLALKRQDQLNLAGLIIIILIEIPTVH